MANKVRAASLLVVVAVALLPLALASSGRVRYRPCTNRILVALSSVGYIELTNGDKPLVGFYLDELAIPAIKMQRAGMHLVFANPGGNTPPVDVRSVNQSYFEGSSVTLQDAIDLVTNSSSTISHPDRFQDLGTSALDGFDAMFIPGGHPPMQDLWQDADLGRILTFFHKSSRPTGAICHGPTALVSANLTSDENTAWVYSGYNMTVFSEGGDEKMETMWHGKLPFYPQDILKENGGNVEEAATYSPHVVVDRELVTGQNPYSAEPFADAFIKLIQSSCT